MSSPFPGTQVSDKDIADIFAQNAQRHPDRLSVVETQSSKTPRREFTYRQIDQASNQVAHHLLENGIERGDFVMIYAHRGNYCLALIILKEAMLILIRAQGSTWL